MYYTKQDVLDGLKKSIAESKEFIELWGRVTLKVKKDGTPYTVVTKAYAVNSKCIDGAEIVDPEFFADSVCKGKIRVSGWASFHHYIDDTVHGVNLTYEGINRAINDRIAYHKQAVLKEQRILDNFDEIYDSFYKQVSNAYKGLLHNCDAPYMAYDIKEQVFRHII